MADGFWTALAVMLVAGSAVALQAPINGRLAAHAGGTLAAAVISFGIGLLVLVALGVMRGETPSLAGLAQAPWWAFAGGALGAWYVWGSAFSVGSLGLVTLVAVVILGQVLTGMVMDAVGAFGLPVREIGWTRLLSVVLVLGGALLSRV
ncbi:amidophosphoribosyltransferase [Brevirhabdus pacifica]|uniref:Amidophosphoribosyltransferase n=1 Tax=Brevirhabdus pacifica TaxID=1267768 RepID=A0A1U7DIQ7_9RHOB|nr:DMT family transporter [Brevirhabdus pacifica]APX89872.1 amidophosphoribosyltransferase [Brevirhabdus pacifica]OWU74407.1 amidophosphoribosyltransferase [Loktanella sp. 22II-4b]PJJ82908.1 transporter family-2 protein [Brevirhabdus pacifica]